MSNKITCKYHQNKDAHFRCGECGTYFCPDCVRWVENKSFVREFHYMCPKCNVETEFLGVNSLVTPFWQNLSHFFKYPFTQDSLIVIGGYGLCAGVLNLIGKSDFQFFASAFSLVFLLLFFSMISYCNFLFHQTMKGVLSPPSVDNANFEFFSISHFKQLLVWGLLNTLGNIVVLKVAAPFNLVSYEIGKVLLPALFILLLVNNSLSFSLNPLRLIAFIQRIGFKNYLLLYLFTSFLLGASDSVRYLLYKVDLHNSFMASFITASAQAYYLIILYHMLAYVVLQFHHKLGWEVNYADFLKTNKRDIFQTNKDVDPLLNDVRFLLGESKPEEALDLIRTETKGVFTSPEIAILFVKLVNQLGHRKKLKYVGDQIVALLFDKNNNEEAVKVYEQCSAEIPGFKTSPDSLYNLTQYYLKSESYSKAMKTGIEFIQRVPNNEKTPQMCLTLADIASEKLSDSKLALRLITHFGKQYKGHELMIRAKSKYASLMP